MITRRYDNTKDKEACLQMFREAGWMSADAEEEGKKVTFSFLEDDDTFVKEIRGNAEAISCSRNGKIRYLNEVLKFGAITCVCTSRIARKLNCATDLVTKSILNLVENEIDVCALGFFEQGFYNRFGFGVNPYENWVKFDPNNLNIERDFRIPHRITKRDYQKIHKALNGRMKRHGMCTIDSAEHTRLCLELPENAFGLGYFNKEEELTHFLWAEAKNENGPYEIWMMSYENYDQFLELMALIKSMGDQVFGIEMKVPVDIQFQDFLKKPFRFNRLTEKTEFENNIWAVAYSQTRILNLERCMEKTVLYSKGPEFNLRLKDPIEEFLPEDSEWKGLGGDYVISLGEKSKCRKGNDESLETLEAGIGAFTRMWLGVRSATALSVTDELQGSNELLSKLDIALRLPVPSPGIEY